MLPLHQTRIKALFNNRHYSQSLKKSQALFTKLLLSDGDRLARFVYQSVAITEQ
jgi:hypothetical protein